MPFIVVVLKCIFKFSNSMTSIILSQVYSIHSNSLMFIDFFKIIGYMKFKANQIYLKQAKIIQDMMSIHYQRN